MKGPSTRAGLAALAAMAASSVTAHSWIESASVIAPNGTYLGPEGFPRGYIPRTDPAFNDKQAQHQIPEGGVYKGDEVLNKFPLDQKPKFPMLRATPGSKVAIRHLENGHVTLPQAQANKPLNRGTVYLYGTSQPKDQEKLFDVHLRWNQDGTGGDKRGRLLATRNYDDGQCFQDNKQAMAQERASKLAADGATVDKELRCQSSITIPKDLKPGTTFTVYWYWDWPTLNPGKVDMEGTKKGQFPWAGAFKRGDKLPNGWGPDSIVVAESYSSVIDIEITDSLPGLIAQEGAHQAAWIDKQDIYNEGIKAQMTTDFDVPVGDLGGGAQPSPGPGAPASSAAPSEPAAAPSAAAPSAADPSAAAPSAAAPSAAGPSAAAPPAAAPPSAAPAANPPAASPAVPPASGAAPPASADAAAPAEPKPAVTEPQPLPGSSVQVSVPGNTNGPSKSGCTRASSKDIAAPGNTGAAALPAATAEPSKAVVTETVTVPPTTVVQTVYVTDAAQRKAKRAPAPSTMVTRIRQAPKP